MKRSEAILKMIEHLHGTFTNICMECDVDILSLDILDFLEKEIGMEPPKRIVNEGYYTDVVNKWEPEDSK